MLKTSTTAPQSATTCAEKRHTQKMHRYVTLMIAVCGEAWKVDLT